MSPTPMTPEDDVEIRNLLARYCVLLDQDDVEQWVEPVHHRHRPYDRPDD